MRDCVYALGHCALIFVAGLSVGLTESLVSSQRVKNFSLYAKKLSGTLLVIVGVYFGITHI
jgi:cytochrome c-type biogenesis protein